MPAEGGLLQMLLIVLALGAAAVALCQRFGLSPILGYLGTGMLVGPHALAWLPDGPNTRLLAELGVVLLMFTIGLEFSLPRLLAAKRLVLGLGSAQVTVTSVTFGLIAWALGWSPIQAVILGGALAMSSTAIVLKQLGEQMELPAPHGRVATGILLFQDIATIPFLVVLPVLAGERMELAGAVGGALLKACLVFVALVLAGRRLLIPILHWVAATRSLELFMLTTLLLALSAAELSALAGLSATLGAFMAGMLIGETIFRHQVEADIRPFRDLMLGLFFVTVGMRLDPSAFAVSGAWIVLWLALLTVIKGSLLVLLILAFRQGAQAAWRAAISLAQGGEFGLLILTLAMGLGLIAEEAAQPVLAAVILSMIIAPLLIRYNGVMVDRLGCRRGSQPLAIEAYIAQESVGLNEHVIICGYGRKGQSLARILGVEGIPFLALDLDAQRVAQAKAAGEPVLYGDVSRPGVLRAAGLERARALVITFDNVAQAERIVAFARHTGSELPILVRNSHERDEEGLLRAGAEVFPEGLESSLSFAGQLLVLLGLPADRVEARLNAIRAEDYAPLRTFFHASNKASPDMRAGPSRTRPFLLKKSVRGRHDDDLHKVP